MARLATQRRLRLPRRTLAGALALLLGAGGAERALACIYDGVLGPGLTAAHPRSIAVAISVRAAMDAGVLPADARLRGGRAGYLRAMVRLRALEQRLSARTALSEPAYVLLVDSNLWARLRPTPDGVKVEAHASPSDPGATVLVTSETAIAAIASEALPVDEAVARGVVEVAGTSAAAETLRTHLSAPAPAPARAAAPLPASLGWQ